jgi:uridine kinase
MRKRLIFLFLFVCTYACAFEPIIIGIAGGTASGKTTLAQKIQAAFPEQSVLISQDAYYKDISHLSLEEREQTNFDHPDALDFDLLKEHILELKQSRSIVSPLYDFNTHSRANSVKKVSPQKLIIVEGILLFTLSPIRDLFDIKIFVDTDDDVRLLRRIERDMQERNRSFSSVKNQYLATVKPMHDAFVGPSKQYADLIVLRGGENLTALSVIVSKLKEVIDTRS